MPKLTPCEQIWDYIHSSDVAAALVSIGERGRDAAVYCIGSGVPRPMKEYVEDVRDIVRPDSEIDFGAIGYYPHQPMYLCADITDLTADTGFRPKVPFREGIADLAEHMGSQEVRG